MDEAISATSIGASRRVIDGTFTASLITVSIQQDLLELVLVLRCLDDCMNVACRKEGR